MDELYLITEEFLKETPSEKFCTVCMDDDDFAGRTAEEVGELCKHDLREALEYTKGLDLGLFCSCEYDVVYLERGGKLGLPTYMDTRYLQGMNCTLKFWAQLQEDELRNFSRLIELAVRKRADNSAPTEDGMEIDADTLKKLNERAGRMGNHVYNEREGRRLSYRRMRRKNPKYHGGLNGGPEQIFTASDAYDPDREHEYTRWFFRYDEIDELLRTIEHDARIYGNYFLLV